MGPHRLRSGTTNAVREGTLQGGPLSPLLSNIVLDEMPTFKLPDVDIDRLVASINGLGRRS